MCGSIGGILISTITGFVLQVTGSYLTVFLMAGSAYLLALLVIQLLEPQIKPAELGLSGAPS